MNQNINLIAFGTFGNPNGFKQTFFVLSDENIARSVKTFDLKTDAISLFPKSKIYSIRKESPNGVNAIAYSIYTYAKEQNSERGGTFIGSSILFLNKIAEENITINCLNDFHNNLVDKNVQNDIIIVNHSERFSGTKKPKDFDKLSNQLKEVEDLNFIQSTNRNLVVYSITSPEKLQQLFQKSLDLLNVYDTIYFTDNEEVATYVNKKGLFQLVEVDGFEQEIQKQQDVRKQKTQTSINEFENEKQKLEVDRKNFIEEFQNQIEQNDKFHQDNIRKIEESKNELTQIIQKYDGYSKKIDESINYLKSGKKLDVVRQFHNENKRIFIDSVNQQKTPIFIHNISKPKTITKLIQNVEPKPVRHDLSGRETSEQNPFAGEQRHRGRKKTNIFKVVIFVLFLLGIATLSYFLLFQTTENNTEKIQPQEANADTTIPNKEKANPIPTKELNPKPTSELNENDYKLVAKKIKKDMQIKDIVHIIFDANPTDIKSTYSTQTEEYANKIIELNKDCFKEDSNRFFFVKDTLRHIPAYKK